MNIIICDDCQEDRAFLNCLLKEYEKSSAERFYITEYASGTGLCEDKEALSNCQIVFLDINMEEQDELKTAIRIKELYPDIYIVLVTAYMSYSLEGYKVKASRFLLKDDLEHTINTFLHTIHFKITYDNIHN